MLFGTGTPLHFGGFGETFAFVLKDLWSKTPVDPFRSFGRSFAGPVFPPCFFAAFMKAQQTWNHGLGKHQSLESHVSVMWRLHKRPENDPNDFR